MVWSAAKRPKTRLRVIVKNGKNSKFNCIKVFSLNRCVLGYIRSKRANINKFIVRDMLSSSHYCHNVSCYKNNRLCMHAMMLARLVTYRYIVAFSHVLRHSAWHDCHRFPYKRRHLLYLLALCSILIGWFLNNFCICQGMPFVQTAQRITGNHALPWFLLFSRDDDAYQIQ